MLTTTYTFSLVGADRDDVRRRLFALPDVPSGARVVVRVPVEVDGPALRLLAQHERRLHVDLQGSPSGVGAWADAIRSTLGEVVA